MENKKIQRYLPLFLHLSIWILVFCLPMILAQQGAVLAPSISDIEKLAKPPIQLILCFLLLLCSVFYWNYLYLIPFFFQKRKNTHYFFALVITFLVYLFVQIIIIKIIFYNAINVNSLPYATSIFPFVLVVSVGLVLRLLQTQKEQEQTIAVQETENLKSELSFLRSQVSPHFLFNVMNNVVSLARLQPTKVEPTLIKLSSLMRYMLYESDDKKVEIRKEVEYLQAYIDLQALRFEDDVKVVFKHHIEENKLIEPMFFIPFVENSFKHGIGIFKNPEINIFLEMKDKKLIFSCLNKFKNNLNDHKDDASGIGLKNVQRRLALLYPDNHSLNIEKKGDWFEVNLEINFRK